MLYYLILHEIILFKILWDNYAFIFHSGTNLPDNLSYDLTYISFRFKANVSISFSDNLREIGPHGNNI
uniref:Putative secreted protein n=1 Tax=Psorophora albipes TaxID=869069 RepID=T1E3J0_9DIPT